MELRRLRVGEAARVGLRPSGQFGQAGRRLGHAGAVGVEGQLGHAPRRFHAVDGFGEVDPRGWLANGVDQRVVRQLLAPRAEQQALAFHRQEVLAVDPGHVGRAAAVAAGGLLGTHAPDQFGGVDKLDMFELDAPALGEFGGCPLQVGVDALAAAPGVEVHRLAARGAFQSAPSRCRRARWPRSARPVCCRRSAGCGGAACVVSSRSGSWRQDACAVGVLGGIDEDLRIHR